MSRSRMRKPEELKVNYSKLERRVFAALPQSERAKLNTRQLAEKVFADDNRPESFHALTAILNVIRSIKRKSKLNDEPWAVFSTPRRGPKPIDHWLGAAD